MLLADVNVFIHAHRQESPRWREYRDRLSQILDGDDERLGVTEAVLASFVRVVTNRRVFPVPTPVRDAFDFCRDVREAPGAVRVEPGLAHWAIFERLCTDVGARGNLVPDTYLAALAIEQGATLLTDDRDFARFPGLRWRLPLGG